jgi:hypothetical protein
MFFLAVILGPLVAALILRPFLGEEYYWMRQRHPGKYPF